MEKVGLFFGSFNPIHIGHLAMASYVLQNARLDKIWFVVSPHNPLKKRSSLLNNEIRYRLVEAATQDNDKFEVCDIEFSLPTPSYTINTLDCLKAKYTDKDFALIIGGDNLQNFTLWKDYQRILDNYKIYVYPREGYTSLPSYVLHPSVRVLDESPYLHISSTFIRTMIQKGQTVKYFVHDRVWEEIEKNNLYKRKNKYFYA